MQLPPQPLFFSPFFCETIWGGQLLNTHFNKSLPADTKIGESWELCGFGKNQTIIIDGPLAGQSLGTIFSNASEDLAGIPANEAYTFPLLVKFIDAHEALSVQVHPDDANAKARFGERFGKTECWYIADAGPHAAISVGFTQDINQKVLREAIATGTIEQLLSTFPVTAGEVYFIPAGTVHAILGDVVIYEVQQSSNTTLRMYDWQRTDSNGKQRPLHIEDAVAVADLSAKNSYRIEPLEICAAKEGSRSIRVACPYFAIEEYRCGKNESIPLQPRQSFSIVSIVKGTADFVWKNGKREARKGSTMLVPAICRDVSIVGNEDCTFLSTFIPDMQQDIIDPLVRCGYSTRQIAALGSIF